LIRRIDQPACGVVRESKEDAARGALKLLFVGNKNVAESWFISFEERETAKDTEVCNAGLALKAVLIGRCWIAILVNDVLGWADIDDVNCIGMGMMKEGAAKSCIVKENVGDVVDFTPFGFAYTFHLLVFRSGSFNFTTK
jgi:hypothetical protein